MHWKADWIWIKGDEKPRNFYLCARKTLELNKKAKRATAFVSADSRYKFYANGKFTGRGVAKCDPKFQYYDVHNITKFLHKGKNVIAAMVHHFGEETFSYLLGRGGFLCQIEIEYYGGKKEIIGTDKTWKVKQEKAWAQDAPRSTVQIGFQEIYDARKEMPGWEKLNFDDSRWEEPIVLGIPPVEPWTNLVERDIPFLAEKERLPAEVVEVGECPQPIDLNNIKDIAAILDKELHLPYERGRSIHATDILCNRPARKSKHCLTIGPCMDKNIYVLLDFGKEVSGFPGIRLEGVDGGIIDFGYDELLIENRIHPARGGGTSSAIKYADRYIMKNGYQEHEQGFTWRGFRYMQLVFRNCSKPVKLYGVTLNHYCYPALYRGAFECSDPMLNRIWEVGRHTLQMCMHDSFEDCPWREQTQWWGDARVQGLVNYYAFGDTALFKKGLRQIAESQLRRNDGLMQPFAPGAMYGSSVHEAMAVIPSFCLIWVLSLYDYYFYTGDIEPVKTLYSNLKKLLEAFRSSLSERGFTALEHWQFIDWAPIDAKPENTALNCFLYAGLVAGAKIARLNNDEPQVQEYEKWATELKNAINKFLWTEEKGLYADGLHDGKQSEVFSQQANCLAVLFDIAPKEKQEKIMEKIQEDEKVVKITTPYFMFYFLSALLHLDKHEPVKDIIRKRWGEMIGKGATTFWEEFGGVPDVGNGGSLCHAWSACPTAILSSEILGVKPLEPGFRKILIGPRLFNLNYAKGIVPAVIGNIKVSWKIKNLKGKKALHFKASIPESCRAEAIIPSIGGAKKYNFSGILSVTHYIL